MLNRNAVTCQECQNELCFVKQCNQSWIEKINLLKNQSLYRQGQYIINEGNPVFGVYFVQNGKIKIVSSGQNGKEQVVRLASNGHIIGHRGLGSEKYPIAAIALDDACICFIDNENLFEVFMANPLFTYHLMMFYSKELRRSEQRTKCLNQMTVEEKIIFALLYVFEIFGDDNGEPNFKITLSRQDIADIVGTNADQISRTITYLKNKKLIDTQGRTIIITDKEELVSLISRYINYSI